MTGEPLPRQGEREATLQECLWIAKNALGQIERGAPSAYWRGLAEEALAQIAAMESEELESEELAT